MSENSDIIKTVQKANKTLVSSADALKKDITNDVLSDKAPDVATETNAALLKQSVSMVSSAAKAPASTVKNVKNFRKISKQQKALKKTYGKDFFKSDIKVDKTKKGIVKLKNTGKYNSAKFSKKLKLAKTKSIAKGGVKSVGKGAAGIGNNAINVLEKSDDFAVEGVAKGVRYTQTGVKGAWKASKRTVKAIKNAPRRIKQIRVTTQNVANGIVKVARAGATAVKATVAGIKGIIAAIAALSPAGLIILISTVSVVGVLFLLPAILGAVASNNNDPGGLQGKEAEIAQKLQAIGYDKIHTAAIMGNMHNESGYRSNACQDGHEYENLSGYLRTDWHGYGLVQWTEGRKNNMCSFCESQHVNHSNEDKQLERMKWEVESGVEWSCAYPSGYGVAPMSYQQWKEKSDDVGYLALGWAAYFERCAYSVAPARVGEAQRIYAALIHGGGGQTGNEIADRAIAEEGKPYIWGACGPAGYDCSGLVCYAVLNQHVHPWTAATFQSWPISDNPQPGDICTSGEHCGVYIGNGKMCHAPQPGEVVKEGPVQPGMTIHKPNP